MPSSSAIFFTIISCRVGADGSSRDLAMAAFFHFSSVKSNFTEEK